MQKHFPGFPNTIDDVTDIENARDVVYAGAITIMNKHTKGRYLKLVQDILTLFHMPITKDPFEAGSMPTELPTAEAIAKRVKFA